MEVVLQRIAYRPDHCLGVIVLPQVTLFSLELPWRGNEHDVSCIPEGVYPLRDWTTDQTGPCLWLDPVPGREGILMHGGQDTRNTRGCILVGEYLDSHAEHPTIGYSGLAIFRLRGIVFAEPGSTLLVVHR